MEQTIREQILEHIKDADMVLLGIGEELSPQLPPEAKADPFVRSAYYASLPEDHEIIRSYNKLRDLIGAKPYFVVTLNTDDLIYRSGLEEDLIVAPCGSMAKLQCTEHIIPAEEICGRVLAANDETLAVCPQCGRPLAFHTVETQGYIEQGYLPQWEKYKRWLSCTLNRKLCILELGAGFHYPQILRWPFEKVAMYNQKAFLIRISSSFWQLAEGLAQKGMSVPANPLEFLNCDEKY
ncbi:MAG: hypothetical protein ACLVEV_06390 [Lachnospiraceae bacterium]|uniref:hypothetical protein n=1 Tax=Parablautia sp. Marseille-Q6255 TaxID=3039593 RepID=UPI0024BCB179|nr:hypothetical protein [Parablautia sp. Marseille-Q6255]